MAAPSRAAPPALLEGLAAIYREADALLAGWSCANSAECCRFGITGKTPYVTSLEVAGLQVALRAAGRRVEGLQSAAGRPPAEGACPFLGPQLRCTVYQARPLGCRTFYCHRAEAGGRRVPHATWRELVRRLEDLARQHQKGGELGRPLTAVFGARG